MKCVHSHSEMLTSSYCVMRLSHNPIAPTLRERPIFTDVREAQRMYISLNKRTYVHTVLHACRTSWNLFASSPSQPCAPLLHSSQGTALMGPQHTALFQTYLAGMCAEIQHPQAQPICRPFVTRASVDWVHSAMARAQVLAITSQVSCRPEP